jgi:ABC-type phosphate transport system substrate-binding protein
LFWSCFPSPLRLSPETRFGSSDPRRSFPSPARWPSSSDASPPSRPLFVESTGPGGGLKFFSAGDGLDRPDIANASRRIKQSEVALCASHGATEIVEVQIGYDGGVLANSKKTKPLEVTTEQIFTNPKDSRTQDYITGRFG